MDVSEVFDSIELVYYKVTDQNKRSNFDEYKFLDMELRMMMLESRPSYPSNRLTFTISNIIRDKDLRFLNIYLNLTRQFDVDLILEDSKRNLINSLNTFLINQEINVWSLMKVSVFQRERSTTISISRSKIFNLQKMKMAL